MRAVQLARTVSITFGLLLPALAAAHPLDPLTADEIRVAAQVARTDARFAQRAVRVDPARRTGEG